MPDDPSAQTKACEHCGETINRRANEWPARWATHRFCSRSCRAYARPRDALKRFWAKVEIGTAPEYAPELGPCWLWIASTSPSNGYGSFYFDGRPRPAHTAAYRMFVGEVPEGLEIDHLCRVRNCVNPEHLEPVTRRENVRRGTAPAAINARKTQCKQGHEFSAENTWTTAAGRRRCRICNRERHRLQRQRERAA